MKAFVLRHGLTNYAQGNAPVTLDEANDILDNSKPIIRGSALDAYERCDGKTIDILSSPTGRALATAKEAYNILTIAGAKPQQITITHDLGEVRGLEYQVIVGLVEGKPIQFGDDIYEMDKAITNPQNLDHILFFRQDAMHVPGYGRKLPAQLQKMIADMETSKSTDQRLEKVLNSLTRDSLLVTHEGLSGARVVEYTGEPAFFLDRGYILELDNSEGRWRPTYMNQPDAARFKK